MIVDAKNRLIRYTMLSTLMLPALVTGAENLQSLDAIEKAASDFVQSRLGTNPQVETRISVGHLDRRLRLSACRQALSSWLPNNSRPWGQITVGVRCDDEQAWSLYVPVHVEAWAAIAVARHALARGTTLQADDVRLVRYELSRIGNGYFMDPEAIVGMQLKRPLNMGKPIKLNHVRRAALVRKGQAVTLVSGSHRGFEVRMRGIAVSEGAAGDTIRVQNTRSRKMLEGVIGPGGEIQILH